MHISFLEKYKKTTGYFRSFGVGYMKANPSSSTLLVALKKLKRYEANRVLLENLN